MVQPQEEVEKKKLTRSASS